MQKAQRATRTTPGSTSWRHFVRHFVEMVVAMVAGMVVLGSVAALVFAQLGWTELAGHPVVSALVMATTMSIGMCGWMRYRGHSWISTAEMAAAMYVSFAVLFVPYWAGALDGDTLLVGGHVLMLPAMVLAMLHRRDEYTRAHAG